MIKLPFRMLDFLAQFAKLITGTRAVWVGTLPSDKQRVYFANHTSNLDTIVIWSALPPNLRDKTRPVAAKDYWDKPGLRRHIATKELNAVLIERNKELRAEDPLNPLRRALEEGSSLIIFPEGKRNQDVVPGDFKSGIYKLFSEFPHVEFVPVYLENVAKTFPKGAFLPLPINCKAHFGKPLKFDEDMYEENPKINLVRFLNTAREEVINLMPIHIKSSVPDFKAKVDAGWTKLMEEKQ